MGSDNGQDELAGKSEITSDEKKGGVVGYFPSHSVVEMPDIGSASKLLMLIFMYLVWAGTSF